MKVYVGSPKPGSEEPEALSKHSNLLCLWRSSAQIERKGRVDQVLNFDRKVVFIRLQPAPASYRVAVAVGPGTLSTDRSALVGRAVPCPRVQAHPPHRIPVYGCSA